MKTLTLIVIAAMTLPAMLGLSESRALAQQPQIWLSPQSKAPHGENVDFMDMFAPDAPWQFTASHTSVFMILGAYMKRTTQESINTVITDLNRRHIALALETGVMNVDRDPPPRCGGVGNIEGYGTVAQAHRLSQMIKAAGGTLKYLAMDEPLYHGHYVNNPHACHDPIPVIIDQAVPTLNAFIEEFPNIIIGDVEPTRFATYDNWQADLQVWATGYQKAMHRPLAFFQLDIPWDDEGRHIPGTDRPSREPDDALEVYQYIQQLKQQGLIEKVGIIEDGTPKDATGDAWVQNAKNHVLSLEKTRGLKPDQVIFQSWMPQPDHALPETRPDTLTGLVDWYVKDFSRQ